jgi:hypothetical protein
VKVLYGEGSRTAPAPSRAQSIARSAAKRRQGRTSAVVTRTTGPIRLEIVPHSAGRNLTGPVGARNEQPRGFIRRLLLCTEAPGSLQDVSGKIYIGGVGAGAGVGSFNIII